MQLSHRYNRTRGLLLQFANVTKTTCGLTRQTIRPYLISRNQQTQTATNFPAMSMPITHHYHRLHQQQHTSSIGITTQLCGRSIPKLFHTSISGKNLQNNSDATTHLHLQLCQSAQRELSALTSRLSSLIQSYETQQQGEGDTVSVRQLLHSLQQQLSQQQQQQQQLFTQNFSQLLLNIHQTLLLLLSHANKGHSNQHSLLTLCSQIYQWSSRFLLLFSDAQKWTLLSQIHEQFLHDHERQQTVKVDLHNDQFLALFSHVRLLIALKRGDDMILRLLDSWIHEREEQTSAYAQQNEKSNEKLDGIGSLFHLLKALACLDAGLAQETIEETSKSIQKCPQFSVPYVIRGFTRLSMVESHDHPHEHEHEHGEHENEHEHEHEHEEASGEEEMDGLNDLNRAVELDQSMNALSLMQRAMATVRFSPHDAFHDIERALELEPDNPTIYLIRGHMNAENESSVDDALQDYSKCIELNQGVPAGYYSRANLLSKYDEYLKDGLSDLDTILDRIDVNYTPAYNLRAIIYHKMEKYDRALQNIEKVIELDPRYPLIYELRGKIYLEGLGDEKTAKESFEKAVEYRSMTCESLLHLGHMYMTIDPSVSLQHFNDAVDMEPYSHHTYFARAKYYFECARNFKLALQDFNQGVEIAQENHVPVSEQVLIDKAGCLIALGDYPKAIAELNEVLESSNASDMNRTMSLILIAECYSRSNRSQEAINHLNRALNLAPNAIVHFKRAILLRDAFDRKQDALDDLNKAIELSSENPEFYFERSVTLVGLNDVDRALLDLNQAIALNPNYVDALGDRASIYFTQSKYKEALEDVNHLIELEPDNVYTFYNLRGKIRSMNGEVHEAKDDFDLAIQLGPNDASLYLNRARLYLESLDDIRKGFMDLSHALTIDEKYFDVYLYRCNYYRTVSKNLKKALEDADVCVRLDAASPYAYFERAMIHLSMQNYDSAGKDLNRAIELQYNDSRVFAARALLKLKLNQLEQSLSDCLHAVNLNSYDVDALNLSSVILLLSKRTDEALDCLAASIALNQTQIVPRIIRAYIHSVELNEPDSAQSDIEWLETEGAGEQFNELKAQSSQVEAHTNLSNLFNDTF